MTEILAPSQRLFAGLQVGQDLGVSAWVPVDQQMIDRFGAATLDPDPMHVDPLWARQQGPFGHTIAFGFLTMSLLTHLLHSALNTDSARDPSNEGYYLNYGFDRLRLIATVPVGSRIRGRFKVLDVRDSDGRIIVKFGVEVEIEGGNQPALVGEWLGIWIPPPAA